MVSVYAIFDEIKKEVYVGLTNNLERRLSEHKRGQSGYTKKYRNPIIFHTEEFENYQLARKREKYLKSGIGKEYLKEQLKTAGFV